MNDPPDPCREESPSEAPSVGATDAAIVILVVDDEPLVQRVNASELRKLGYTVVCAGTGEEAVAYLTDHPVDLVLLDLMMPGMDGVDTYRAIKAVRPAQKAVVYSGFADPAKVREIRDLGAHRILIKPTPVEELADAIADALRGTLPGEAPGALGGSTPPLH
jgi:CheY-like chemotaxis protein